MSTPGPPRKPTTLKLLQGTFRKDRASAREPRPSGEPTCPTFLSPAAKAVWRRVAPELISLGVAKAVDQDVLGAYCSAVADFHAADAIIQRDGLVCEGAKGGTVRHPATIIKAAAAELIRRLGAEFGMTPASRSRVNADPPAPTSDKPAKESFFNPDVKPRRPSRRRKGPDA